MTRQTNNTFETLDLEVLANVEVELQNITRKRFIPMTQFTTELLNFGSIISVVGKTTVEIIELFEMVPPQG
ncbi:hypothetical protein ACXORQ_02630 [Streptococcus thermophilus]